MPSLAPIIKRSKPCELTITNHGILHGLAILDDETNHIKCFRYTGIPFAKPPVGPLRWRKPVPLEKDYDYSGDYSDFKSVCPQPIFDTVEIDNDTVYDEDCLFLNIWIPAASPPDEGWPVLFFIHGGFLQVGNPHHTRQVDPQDLLSNSSPLGKYIIVTCGYRLNLFGFLSGKELLEENDQSSNFGFWDQRLALEWVYDNIGHFSGNQNNISIGGLSAGSYSAIFQLSFELFHPEERQIIKRALLISNGLAIQPKSIVETQEQFDLLVKEFGIPSSYNGKEKLEKLRSIPFKDLINRIPRLKLHTFRAVTDGHFVSKTLLDDIFTGKFGSMVKSTGRTIMIGEVVNEWLLYANTNTPESIDDLFTQIGNYYPENICKALIDFYPEVLESDNQEKFRENLKQVYGQIVSDMQIYVSSRLLINSFKKAGMGSDDVYRYHIAYRGKYFDKYALPEDLVPHAGDTGIWFYTVSDGILENEKQYYINWLKPVSEWMATGKTKNWGTSDLTEYRVFHPDGFISIEKDVKWDWGLKVAEVVATASSP